jgi:hypothetical protein
LTAKIAKIAKEGGIEAADRLGGLGDPGGSAL